MKLRKIKIQVDLEITVDTDEIDNDQYFDAIREVGGIEEFLVTAARDAVENDDNIMEVTHCERVSNGDNGEYDEPQCTVTAKVVND